MNNIRVTLILLGIVFVFFLSACGSPAMEARYGKEPPPPPSRYRMTSSEMYPNNPQAQALVTAAIKGDVKAIDLLIDAGADPNAVGSYGITVPGWVLYHPNEAGFRRLLERGADPNKIWYNGSRPQSSLLHEATSLSASIGLDYLRLCLTIGKGDPNLEPPDKSDRVIAMAVQPGREAAFALLYKFGAQIDYSCNVYCGYSLIQRTAGYSNYKLVLYMLEQGVNYMRIGDKGVKSLQAGMQLDLEYSSLARKSSLPQYMWFWRCVDWLEKHGVIFDYAPAKGHSPAVRPAVLDTTPPDVLGPAKRQ